jgi:hypothetical protein
MRHQAILAAAVLVAACSTGSPTNSSSAKPAASASKPATSTSTTASTGPLSLTVDGKAGDFNFTPVGPITDLKFLKLWSIGNKRSPGKLTPNEIYTNLSLTSTGPDKDLGAAGTTAADIKQVALDVTYSVDGTVASGWTLTIDNPAAVADAKFSFAVADGKVSVHVEGVGKVKDVNKDKVAAAPKLVFDGKDLPATK